jgi:hypothetical protein
VRLGYNLLRKSCQRHTEPDPSGVAVGGLGEFVGIETGDGIASETYARLVVWCSERGGKEERTARSLKDVVTKQEGRDEASKHQTGRPKGERPAMLGRLSFVLLLVSQLIATMGFTFVMPFTPLYVQELGVEDAGRAAAWAGFVNGATGLTMALAAPLWGRLADRTGRKLMLLRATLAGSVEWIMLPDPPAVRADARSNICPPRIP